MAIAPGSRIGPYEVVSLLGAGGTGEVYRARDTRLERDVAIKLLPDAVAANPDRRRRFEQEARAVASLNHPHICQIYDVGPRNTGVGEVRANPRAHDARAQNGGRIWRRVENVLVEQGLQAPTYRRVRNTGCYTEPMRSVADLLREGTRREQLSPEARVQLAFRLGDSDLEALCEARGLSAADARAAFARSRRHGRRPSRSHGD